MCGACLRGLHPRLLRYRLPDGGLCVLTGHVFHILVIEVLPSRQQGVVRVSGGFTPGYRDTVFQTDLVACWSEGFPPVMEVPSSRRVVQVCFPCTRSYTRLWRYCLPGSRVWCVRPGAPPRLWRFRLPDGWPSAHAYVFRQSSYDRCSCVRNRSLNRLVSRKKACVYVNLDLKH